MALLDNKQKQDNYRNNNKVWETSTMAMTMRHEVEPVDGGQQRRRIGEARLHLLPIEIGDGLPDDEPSSLPKSVVTFEYHAEPTDATYEEEFPGATEADLEIELAAMELAPGIEEPSVYDDCIQLLGKSGLYHITGTVAERV
jgi:hypothetical protein